MIFSGTYRAKKKSCLNCNHFMLWGTSYGYCLKHNEDMYCANICSKFRTVKYYLPYKEIYVNETRYVVEKFNCAKMLVYTVEKWTDEGVMYLKELNDVALYKNPKQVMDSIKNDTKNLKNDV